MASRSSPGPNAPWYSRTQQIDPAEFARGFRDAQDRLAKDVTRAVLGAGLLVGAAVAATRGKRR